MFLYAFNKKATTTWILTQFKEIIYLDLYFAENHFYVLLIKSNQSIQKVILSFSASLSVFQPFFSWINALQSSFMLYIVPSLFGTQHHLIRPPVKSPTLSLRKMPTFQGVAPRHTNFTLSSVILVWDSATAHSPFSKELMHPALEDVYFSGLIVPWCSDLILHLLSLIS